MMTTNTAYETLVKFNENQQILDILHNENLSFTDKEIKLHARIPIVINTCCYYAVIVDLEDKDRRHIFIIDYATPDTFEDIKDKYKDLIDAIYHTYNAAKAYV